MTKWHQLVLARLLANKPFMIAVLTGGNLLFNVISNASLKISADSRTWRPFLAWQVAGNLTGLITVLTLTALLRYLPLHVAFPLTMGLTVIGVQVLAAHGLFHESIGASQWLGTLLVVVGILLIGAR
jgi:multidrug transporter EmrE-like cation transporter